MYVCQFTEGLHAVGASGSASGISLSCRAGEREGAVPDV